MVNRLSVIAALAMLSVSSFAFGNFAEGNKELTLSGSGNNNNDFDAGAVSVAGSFGYFLTDAFEVGVRQSISHADSGDGSSTSLSTRVFADFHFDLGAWRPFVGINAGYVYGDDIDDTWEMAPEGGVKYFVNDTTFIFAMVEYQFFFDDTDDIDSSFDDGQFVYSLGIGFRW
jgi:outer membrane protein W